MGDFSHNKSTMSKPWILAFLLPLFAHADLVPISEFKVVLDPGHGGSDLGAVHRDPKTKKIVFTEKQATLKIALEVKRQLTNKKYPVLLTRSKDADIALNARTAIANREKAKIFISIHMNSVAETSHSHDAEGVETYILNNTTDGTSKRLAELENKGLDPTRGSTNTKETEVNLILKDLTLDANQPESKRLACSLQNQLVSLTGQKHRGVKQALFMVLLGADMPSALLEVGFVHSHKDRKLITTDHGIRAVSAAIVRAIELFRLQTGTPEGRKSLSTCLIIGQAA